MTRFIDAYEYVKLPGRELNWLVHGLIPRPGFVLLIGQPKAGKTFLAWDVLRRVTRGEPVLGQPTVASRGLYIQLDTRVPIWQDRLSKQIEADIDVGGPLIIHPDDEEPHRPIDILRPESRAWLTDVVTEADPALVVVDVLRKLHRADENDNTAMTLVWDALEHVFRGRSVILVHHMKKVPEDVTDPDPIRYARGASVLLGDVDAYWTLHGGALKVVSRMDERTSYKAVFDRDVGVWTFPEMGAKDGLTQAVLALCVAHPTLSHNAIARIATDTLGVSRRTYFRHLAGRACAHTPTR